MASPTAKILGSFITAYGEREVDAQLTLTNSYPAANAGYAIPASLFGLNTFVSYPDTPTAYRYPVIVSNGNKGYVGDMDSSGNLHMYVTGTAANDVLNEVAAATNLSAVVVTMRAIGH